MAVTIQNTIELQPEFFGEKTIILAKSGYGKSYTARVLIEEGLKLGNTFVIIDPQDAYLNLQGFEYVNIEKVKSARGLAVLLAASHRNTVIRMKKLGIEQQNEFLRAFLTEFRLNITKGIQTVVIDEMHKYAPEGEKSASKEIVRGMFQENRSDGLGIIGISQRISRIDKTCLAQADNLCIGKVTAFRDKEAIKNYIDEPEDLEKIKSLEKGEFYFYGFGLNEAIVEKVRKAETEHSGSSPKNLLTEDTTLFQKHKTKFYKEEKKMSDEITTGSGTLNKVLPSVEGFKDLAALGAKVSLGMAAGGIVGSYVGMKFASPIPVVSSRTLGSAASTVVLYAGYRAIPQPMVKDVMKYAAAGSAVFTAGSLVFDLLNAAKIKVPNLVSFALATATGASPMVVSKAQSSEGSDVDLNTEFQ